MVKLNKIYTRTGDDGTTGLVDGSRVSKADPRMIAIGDVDEANSAIGVAIASLGDHPVISTLSRIQNDLFDLGADLATPGEDFIPSDMVLRMIPAQVDWLEREIDKLNDRLEPLRSFILPGGSALAAHLHLCRTVARRAERIAVALVEAGDDVGPEAMRYLNRLSDFLFVAARHANDRGAAEVFWQSGATR